MGDITVYTELVLYRREVDVEALCIIGSVEFLGAWSVFDSHLYNIWRLEDAAMLEWRGNGEWSIILSLPRRTTLEFKFCVLNKQTKRVVAEEEFVRRLTIYESSMRVNMAFNKMWMVARPCDDTMSKQLTSHVTVALDFTRSMSCDGSSQTVGNLKPFVCCMDSEQGETLEGMILTGKFNRLDNAADLQPLTQAKRTIGTVTDHQPSKHSVSCGPGPRWCRDVSVGTEAEDGVDKYLSNIVKYSSAIGLGVLAAFVLYKYKGNDPT